MTILKEKILEKYPNILYFCNAHNISYCTVRIYTSGKKSINVMSKYTLQKICYSLKCNPEDIGYTKKYWWTPPNVNK